MAKHKPTTPEHGFYPELETQIFLPGSRGLELDSAANLLTLDRSVKYPTREEYVGKYLSGLILEEPRSADPKTGSRTLLLPNNFITFAQVFNDALGAYSYGDDSKTQLAHDNLFRIGAKLAGLVDQDDLVPVGLTYKNILLVRGTDEVKLLPPLQLDPVINKEQAKTQIVDDFLSSCLDGATPGPQLNQFMEVSDSFTSGIEASNG